MRNTWWILIATAGLVAITGANCQLPIGEEPIVFNDSFENGLAAWTQGSDVPEDPNNPGQPVAWSIEQSDEQADDGQYSARFYLTGCRKGGSPAIR